MDERNAGWKALSSNPTMGRVMKLRADLCAARGLDDKTSYRQIEVKFTRDIFPSAPTIPTVSRVKAAAGTTAPGPFTAKFGNGAPFTEPYWYQGFPSAYYTDSHVQFRNGLRAFIDAEIIPFADDWIASPTGYPSSLHERFYKAGFGGAIFPAEYGGTPPAQWVASLPPIAPIAGGVPFPHRHRW
jgi:hypothetical protein